MTMDGETREVFASDAVYIPGNVNHGINNIGNEALEYITANSPVSCRLETRSGRGFV